MECWWGVNRGFDGVSIEYRSKVSIEYRSKVSIEYRSKVSIEDIERQILLQNSALFNQVEVNLIYQFLWIDWFRLTSFP